MDTNNVSLPHGISHYNSARTMRLLLATLSHLVNLFTPPIQPVKVLPYRVSQVSLIVYVFLDIHWDENSAMDTINVSLPMEYRTIILSGLCSYYWVPCHIQLIYSLHQFNHSFALSCFLRCQLLSMCFSMYIHWDEVSAMDTNNVSLPHGISHYNSARTMRLLLATLSHLVNLFTPPIQPVKVLPYRVF